ncbi:MAG: hypothetical protein CM1200mP40_11750 [Gammaproteobacteria bacterium]|nr:MAG: hypothetical protein CM1200mP40_11750 [Gammaproteobacteria bacterium]
MADTAETDEVLEIEDQDDLALVKRMQEGGIKLLLKLKRLLLVRKKL